MAVLIKDGVWETTQTQGTGTLTLLGAKVGRRTFASAFGTGVQCKARVSGEWGFEVFKGTVVVAGATTTLSRDTVLSNDLGTTARRSLPAGTHDVVCDLSAVTTPQSDEENDWTEQQNLGGNRLTFSVDESTYVESASNNRLSLGVHDEDALQIEYDTGFVRANLLLSENSDVEGPELVLDRTSTTPAANDSLGIIRFFGRNSAAVKTSYAKIFASIADATSGSEDGRLNFLVAAAGSLTSALTLAAGRITARTGFSIFTNDKSSTDPASVGAEMLDTGGVVASVTGGACFIANRTLSDGTLVSLRQANTEEGAISVSGTTVSYGTFAAHHDTWWSGSAPQDCPLGTVLEAAEGAFNDRERLPLVRIAQPGSKAVYGVYVDDNPLIIEGKRDRRVVKRLKAMALGAFVVRVKGPIGNGDLLCMSDEAGVAWRQADDVVRSGTIGKATMSDGGESVRTVSCVLMCG
jgi:hypothetical protein